MDVRVEYFLLCENSLTDDSGKVSIINIYINIIAPQVPFAHRELHYVALCTRNKGIDNEHVVSVNFSIVTPSGKEKLPRKQNTMDVTFPAGKAELAVHLSIPGVVLEEFGEYTAAMRLNDKLSAKKVFKVIEGSV